MRLTGNYKVENNGIWISKEELQSWKDHHESVADNCNGPLFKMFYKGKSDMLTDLLKTIERGEGEVSR